MRDDRVCRPENLLWAEDGCKISDFGLVINHREEVANTCLGTFDYMVSLPSTHSTCACVCMQLAQPIVACITEAPESSCACM